MYVSAVEDQRKMVSYLLEHGADPAALDDDSLSALHHVSISGNIGELTL